MNPHYSYDNVFSLTESEFREKSIKDVDLKNPEKFTKSSIQDLETIERILDLKSGILKNEELYLQRSTCPCGHMLTMKDFILTALVDAKHDKSMIIQTFLGNKYVINKPRPVRCFDCGTINPMHSYGMKTYGCSWEK